MPGMGELVVILLIVLVVFGANKLPGIGDALGRSIKNFKNARPNVEDDDDDDETKSRTPRAARQLAAGQEAEGARAGRRARTTASGKRSSCAAARSQVRELTELRVPT